MNFLTHNRINMLFFWLWVSVIFCAFFDLTFFLRLNYHTNFPKSCPDCGLVLSTKHAFVKHVNTLHSTAFQESTVPCEICGKLGQRTNIYILCKYDKSLCFKMSKCEIFKSSDFHNFYTIKHFWVGNFGAEYKLVNLNSHHLISDAHFEHVHQFLTRMFSARIRSWRARSMHASVPDAHNHCAMKALSIWILRLCWPYA